MATKRIKFTPTQQREVDLLTDAAYKRGLADGELREYERANDRGVRHAIVLNGKLQEVISRLTTIVTENSPTVRQNGG